MAAGLAPPKRVFAHGWWTNEGRRCPSRSATSSTPDELVKTYGLDPVRYFLLREVPFGNDGDFQTARADRPHQRRPRQRLTAISPSACCRSSPRTAASRCRAEGPLTEADDRAARPRQGRCWPRVRAEIDEQAFHRALDAIWDVVGRRQPLRRRAGAVGAAPRPIRRAWRHVLWVLAETIRRVTLLVQPFMPDSAAKILDQLGVPAERADVRRASTALVPGTACPRRRACSRATSRPKAEPDADRQPLPSRLPRARRPTRPACWRAPGRAGVGLMLTIGTRLDQFDKVRAIAERHGDVWCSVGVHPHEAKEEGQTHPATA